jgi:hypothetical protein
MARKLDISTTQLSSWDHYKDKKPDEALSSIYSHAAAASSMMCGWYWNSIKLKRNTSLWVRAIAFILLVVGTALPIFAATQDTAEEKLWFTQCAVALLAIGGLMLVADRVFGWSSGWMRYITTVTTMENLTRAFELEWARYVVSRVAPLDVADVKTLFELAEKLEQELTKLQADETTKWIAEFNTGISLLESLIKTQREETDKQLQVIRTSPTAQEAADKAEEKARKSGAIELTLSHKSDPKKVRISMDDNPAVDFLGQVWSRLNVSPGPHVIKIETSSEPVQTIEKIVEVAASSVARIEVKLAT